MEIVFVRHTAVDVPKGMCYGRSDVALASSFEKEAAEVAKLLANEGNAGDIFTSPLSRCVRLAEFCGYPSATRDDRLLELDFGEWEMKFYDLIEDPGLQRWYDDYLHVAPTGGEAFTEQLERVREFIYELKSEGCMRATAFTHGGVLLCALILSDQIRLEDAMSRIPPYGSVIRLSF